MRNAKPKDYLGKAKLVAAESATEAYTTFTGSTRMAQGYTPSGAPLETRPDQMLSVGGGLAPSPSFSRARNPETVKPVERAASATARLERQNTTLQVSNVREAANAQRANTVGSRNGVSSPLRERTTSPVRGGRSFRYSDNSRANIRFMIADTPPLSNTRADGLPMRGLSLRGRQNTLPLAAGDRKSPPRPDAAGRGGGREYTFLQMILNQSLISASQRPRTTQVYTTATLMATTRNLLSQKMRSKCKHGHREPSLVPLPVLAGR
jgi:hypothetical protein